MEEKGLERFCICGMSATLAVPAASFAGYAFFSLLNLLASILLAWLGLRMLKRTPHTKTLGQERG